jgi:hypothetical protein
MISSCALRTSSTRFGRRSTWRTFIKCVASSNSLSPSTRTIRRGNLMRPTQKQPRSCGSTRSTRSTARKGGWRSSSAPRGRRAFFRRPAQGGTAGGITNFATLTLGAPSEAARTTSAFLAPHPLRVNDFRFGSKGRLAGGLLRPSIRVRNTSAFGHAEDRQPQCSFVPQPDLKTEIQMDTTAPRQPRVENAERPKLDREDRCTLARRSSVDGGWKNLSGFTGSLDSRRRGGFHLWLYARASRVRSTTTVYSGPQPLRGGLHCKCCLSRRAPGSRTGSWSRYLRASQSPRGKRNCECSRSTAHKLSNGRVNVWPTG